MKTLKTFDEQLFIYIYNKTNYQNVKKIFKFLTTISKPFFIIIYLLLLLTMYSTNNSYLYICIYKPFFTLLFCKFLRKTINRKRPYLVFNKINLQKKEDASMPSNHTASSFIISFMFFYISTPLALLTILLATLVSLSRIIIGIHFPLDVLCGFLIALSFYVFI